MSIRLVLYGGTGGLIGRAMVLLLMVNPLKALPNNQKHRIECLIRDYDTRGTEGSTDYSQLTTVIQAYQKLHKLGMECIASAEVQSVTNENLKTVRNRAYSISDDAAQNMTFSLSELFCGVDQGIENMFLSCLTSEQMRAKNEDGCFGDLARNAFIAEGMSNGFSYNNLSSGDVVFYIGSTDGGTANTVLDVDAQALLDQQTNRNNQRTYKIYSIRTLPYKKFPLDSNDLNTKADAERIYNDMIAQSSGVLSNILNKITSDGGFSYALPKTTGNRHPNYLFDGIFLAGYNVENKEKLDDTNVNTTIAQTRQQFHYNHGTELVSALMAVDVLNNEVAFNGNIYGYDVNIPDGTVEIKSVDLFSAYRIDNLTLEERIMKFAKLYAVVKLHLYSVFSDPDTNFKPHLKLGGSAIVGFIKLMYHLQFMGDGRYNPDEMKAIADNVFKPFIENAKYFLEFIQQVQEHTQFATGAEVISILPKDQLRNLLNGDAGQFIYDGDKLCISGTRGAGTAYTNLTARLGEKKDLMKKFRNEAIGGEVDRQKQSIAVGRKLLDIVYDCL